MIVYILRLNAEERDIGIYEALREIKTGDIGKRQIRKGSQKDTTEQSGIRTCI